MIPRRDCDLDKLGTWAERFAPLPADAENESWIAEHAARPHGRLRTTALAALYHVMPLYDAHGLTGSYPMHLLSTAQLRALLGDGHERVLDVGAGRGDVTRHATALAREVVCTETSKRLARRLERQGFRVYCQDIGEVPLPEQPSFDAILCLNVLDRTSHPRRLLQSLKALCAPHTRLLVSLPVPVAQAVFVAGGSVSARETLPRQGQSFESAITSLCEQLFVPAGFHVERLARAPYYSTGDAQQPLYILDAALFTLRHPRRGRSVS